MSNNDDFETVHVCYLATLDIIRQVLSFAVAVAGGVVLDKQKKYLGIVDNYLHFTRELAACAAIGVLVFVLSMAKTLVSYRSGFGNNFGRYCIGHLLTLTLSLIGVVNFGMGISAGTKCTGKTLEKAYFESANRTFLKYENTYIQWDYFQSKFDCCGVAAASDYVQIFHQANIVPASCCNLPLLSSQGMVCSDIVANVTADDLVANRIYNKGCVEAVITEVTNNFIVAAVILIASFMLLIDNIVLTWFISFNLGIYLLDKK